MATAHRWTSDTEKIPIGDLLGVDEHEAKELLELTEMQEALDQSAVVTGHALSAVGVASESPQAPLLYPRVSEMEDPPLTCEDIQQSKYKHMWYDSNMSEFNG